MLLENLDLVFRWLVIASFFGYGSACLLTEHMVEEFERYGLSRFRKLTGLLEIIGSLGLLCGFLVPVITIISASGLAVLMVLGLAARIKAGDGILQMLPAVLLGGMNVFIVWMAL